VRAALRFGSDRAGVPCAGVNFTIDPAAQSLLSITGQQVSARKLHSNPNCAGARDYPGHARCRSTLLR